MAVDSTQPVYPPQTLTPITSVWGQAVSDSVVQKFASTTDRTNKWVNPPAGSLSTIIGSGILDVYRGSTWRHLVELQLVHENRVVNGVQGIPGGGYIAHDCVWQAEPGVAYKVSWRGNAWSTVGQNNYIMFTFKDPATSAIHGSSSWGPLRDYGQGYNDFIILSAGAGGPQRHQLIAMAVGAAGALVNFTAETRWVIIEAINRT